MRSFLAFIVAAALFGTGLYVGRRSMIDVIPVDQFDHAMDSMQQRVADIEAQKAAQGAHSDSIIAGLAAYIAADTLPVPQKVSHAYHAQRDHSVQQLGDSMLTAPPAGSR